MTRNRSWSKNRINYFFRLSAYQQQLEDLLTSGRLRIVPESRYNEALSFIRQGLQDFSISRISERSGGWGIPVPGDPTQTLYVWFEALTNYLTGLGYGTDENGFARYWQNGTNRTHVIGKNVIKFHAIYWPATLLSAGLPLPDTLVVHGFLTVEGQKISKSLGNAIDPFPLAEQYGADVLRYYLLRAITSGGDDDFSTSRLKEIYTADLANGLGNLVRRLDTLCERSQFQNKIGSIPELSKEYQDAVENYQFHTALRTLWEQIRTLNQHIETTRPWEGLKSDNQGALHLHLETWVQEILSIAHGLSPFLPETAETIHRQFSRSQIKQVLNLFPRID